MTEIGIEVARTSTLSLSPLYNFYNTLMCEQSHDIPFKKDNSPVCDDDTLVALSII